MSLAAEAIDRLPYVDGVLHYLAASEARIQTFAFDPPPGTSRTNAVYERRTVAIRDLRPVAEFLSLDREGFSIVEHSSSVTDFYDEEQLPRLYYPEAEQLIAAATGACRVVVFDHTIRRRVAGKFDRDPGIPRQPSTQIHGDYTPKSAPQRLREVMGDEAEMLLRRRFSIVNIWRPIRGPLRDAPLALCDAKSVDSGDLIATDLIYRDRTGESYALKFRPGHRWFYAPDMREDEALLLKCYDSAEDGRARFVPHTSFLDPAATADILPRESIEFRTFAFYPP